MTSTDALGSRHAAHVRLPGEDDPTPEALCERSRLALAEGDIAAAHAAATEAEDLARARGDAGRLGWALVRRALVHARQGDSQECLVACEEAVDCLSRTGDPLGIARSLSLSAVILTLQGRIPEGVTRAARAVARLADVTEDSLDLAATHANIASILLRLGDADSAATHDRRAIEIARGLGVDGDLLAFQTHAVVTLADAARRDLQAGDTAGGRARAVEGLDEARAAIAAAREATGGLSARTTLEIAAADLLGLAGRGRESLLRIDAALPAALALEQPQIRAGAQMVRGAALRALGRLDESLDALDSALDAAEILGYPTVLADVHHERALLLEAFGRHAEALDAYRRFHELSEAVRRGEGAGRISALGLRVELEEVKEASERERARVAELSQLVDDLRSQSREFARTSLEDPLTGLPNRRALDALLAARLKRSGGAGPLCVAIVDVDHFKDVNDHYGHLVGDAVLRIVAEVLRQQVRGQDLAARFGGDEFVVVLDGIDAERSKRVCERVRQEIAGADWASVGGPPDVTVSVGVAAARPGHDAAALMAAADAALYRAKSAGRDRVSAGET